MNRPAWIVPTVFLLAVCAAMAAEPPKPVAPPAKAAWEWSDQERVAARFSRASGLRPGVLDGARDPALFLPFELFDVLLEGLHADETRRAEARTALAPGIRAMGLREGDFWIDLQRVASPYLLLLGQPSRMTVQRVKTPAGVASFPVDLQRCVARHQALETANATFGTENFRRFLYSSVAPQVRNLSSTQQLDPAQELLFVAQGCRP